MEAVDVFVDMNGLTRVGTELRAVVGQFADIGRPADIAADADEMGDSEVSDAVAELGARWQHRYDGLEQDLSDAATQVELAVKTYDTTEADLALRCADGQTAAVNSSSPRHGHGASGS